uniref:G-protein coupled receptors family 1 profile domain-containing protein n=1 Tax=Oryzias sinensis TaxID=183150 RepID=A0A8C7ZMN2_9TELE
METLNFTHGSAPGNSTSARTNIALPVLMFVGGAVGNLTAIVVLSVSRQEKKSSAFYTMVCGLAVTDLLGTCLASPLTIANYLDRHVLKDKRVCDFHSFLLLFFSLTGLSIICAMAAERYMAICCPYTYQRWGVNRCFAQKFLFLIYISHIFFCCLPMMGMAKSALQLSETWCFIDWRAQERVAVAYSALYGVVSLLLILSTIALNLAVCGTLLLMRRRTVQRPVTRASARQRWKALSSATETQMIAVLVMTSVVVLTCSAPLVVRVFANRFKIDHTADLAAIRAASVNAILDPWIYILFRRSLLRRLLSLTRRRSTDRRISPPLPQRKLLCPDMVTDRHEYLLKSGVLVHTTSTEVKNCLTQTRSLRCNNKKWPKPCLSPFTVNVTLSFPSEQVSLSFLQWKLKVLSNVSHICPEEGFKKFKNS